MCVAVSTVGAGGKTRLESSTRKFKPLYIYIWILRHGTEQAAKVDGVINAEQATTVNGAINGKGAKVSSKGAKKATRMRRDHGKSAKTSEKPSVDNEAKLTNTVGNKKHGHQHHHSHGGDAADGSTNMPVSPP